MSNQEPSGCLFAIFKLLGISLGGQSSTQTRLPYRLRDDFLSNAERSFYHVLCQAVGDRGTIFAKVNLADLFYVVQPQENQAYRNKIDRKHVDFVLADKRTTQPLMCIELDDSSHHRNDRVERDRFVDDVFRVAGMRLIRVRAARNYDLADVRRQIDTAFTQSFPAVPQQAIEIEKPMCPKCGVPMVKRTSTKRQNKGASFWGCINYPKCREIVSGTYR